MTNILARQMVGKRHHLLEQIVNTGEVPLSWTSGFMTRFFLGARAQDRQHKYSLRKLDELIRYVYTTPLVADKETREVLVERLSEVRADWTARAGSPAVNCEASESRSTS